MVSDVLRKLRKTTFPSHAIVGSGIYEESIEVKSIQIEQWPFILLNRLGCSKSNEYCETERRLVNYVFNLDHEKGAASEINNPRPWSDNDGGNGPNYDLTVRLPSMEGGLREQAVSDIFAMVGEDAAADFVGKLTHLRNFESPEVSARVESLLHIPTSSQYFDRFPAVKDIVDDFDKEMQAKFPNLLVDAFLKVGVPMNSQDSCFETEASERLNSGDSASRIIPYNETWGR